MGPQALWRLTPRELALCLRALLPRGSIPPQRDDLAALIARFPDP